MFAALCYPPSCHCQVAALIIVINNANGIVVHTLLRTEGIIHEYTKLRHGNGYFGETWTSEPTSRSSSHLKARAIFQKNVMAEEDMRRLRLPRQGVSRGPNTHSDAPAHLLIPDRQVLPTEQLQSNDAKSQLVIQQSVAYNVLGF